MTTAVAAPMVRAVGLRRDFPSGGGVVHALRGVNLTVAARRDPGRSRPLGQRQDDAAEPPRRPRSAHVGERHGGRAGGSGASDRAQSELRRTTVAYMFQTFGLIPILSAAENVEIPLRLLSADPAERDRRVHELLGLVASAVGRITARPSCPAGNSSAFPWLEPWPPGPSSCSRTSQRASSTSRRATGSCAAPGRGHRAEGVTVIVATHDPMMLDVADRVVELHDGQLVGQ